MDEISTLTAAPAAAARAAPGSRRSALALAAGVFGVSALGAGSLWQLGRFAATSEIYSYILLIPAVSLYFAWQHRPRAWPVAQPQPVLAVFLLVIAAGLMAGEWMGRRFEWPLAEADVRALETGAWLAAVGGVVAGTVGRPAFRCWRFPLLFLLFLIPLPVALQAGVENLLQHGSALVARTLFLTANTPVFYQDLHFHLPGINLHVARECSGIRSSLVLLIVSVIAGQVFLRRPRHRWILVGATVPLALIRNGFRIFTIGELCTRHGPQMIDSFLHRHGGPFFFAASLAPLLLILFVLQKFERRRGHAPSAAGSH